MARPKNKKKTTTARTARDPQRDAQFVRDLLSRGRGREALEAARALWAKAPSPDALLLLADAIELRCRELEQQGMHTEALALLRRAMSDHADLGARVEPLLAAAAARAGSFDVLAPALLDPSPERRATAEAAIRTELVDLGALAACGALPPDHPLRTQAAVLHDAFTRVTSGPVDDAALALREVPRRSALAPWVHVVRAIAAFHRNEDDACRRSLQAVPTDASPHRLALTLQDLMDGATSAKSIELRLGGADADVLSALRKLDEACRTRKHFSERAAEALTACERAAPDVLPELRRRVLLRGSMLGANAQVLNSYLAGKCPMDAAFWRLFARALEKGDESGGIQAAMNWEQFRKHALHEGLIEPEGAAAGALYLHMASLVDQIPPADVDYAVRQFTRAWKTPDHLYAHQPAALLAVGRDDPSLPKGWFLNPRTLFLFAAAADPHAAVFEQWHAWESQGGDPARAAEAWRDACPHDVKPVIELMRAAEGRKALVKAQKLLDEAEAIDPLHPEVRRARWRFLTAAAVGHLRGGKKVHLALKDAARMDALPDIRDGCRRAFTAAVRWIAHLVQGDSEQAAAQREETARVLGHPWAGASFRYWLWQGVRLPGFVEMLPPLPDTISFAPALARALELLHDVAFRVKLDAEWSTGLLESLERGGSTIESGALLSLGKAAADTEMQAVAWAASRLGLRREDVLCPRFLRLRASLIFGDGQREDDCLAAAVTLARQAGDHALVDEVVEDTRGNPFLQLFGGGGDRNAYHLDPAEVRRVLDREKDAAFDPSAPAERMLQMLGDIPF